MATVGSGDKDNNLTNNNNVSEVVTTPPPPPPPVSAPPIRLLYPISRTNTKNQVENNQTNPDTVQLNSYQRYQQQQLNQYNNSNNDSNNTMNIEFDLNRMPNPNSTSKPTFDHLESVNLQQLYNALQDIAIPKLILDLRPKVEYDREHIKTSISLPIPTLETIELLSTKNNNTNNTSNNNNNHFTLESFNLTKYIVQHCPSAKYWNLIFSKCIIYTDDPEDPAQIPIDQDKLTSHRESDSNPLSSFSTKDWKEFVIHYMLARTKQTTISIFKDGYPAFKSKYEFLLKGTNYDNQPKYKMLAESALYPSEVLTDFLYLGSYENASSRTQIDNLKITHIVNMAIELDDVFPHLYKYYRANLEDNFKADIKKHIQPVISFINDAKASGGRVLVHCAMGISRSTTVVIAYLIQEHGLTYTEARKFVKEKRSIIQPNFGFVKVLKEFDVEVHSHSNQNQSHPSNDPSLSSSNVLITNSDGLILPINSSL